MSLYSDDDMKIQGMVQVKCLKFRGTEPFMPHMLKVNPRSKFVYDLQDDKFHDDGLEFIPAEIDEVVVAHPPATVEELQISDEEVL